MIHKDMKVYFVVLSACLVALLPCTSSAQEKPQWKRILNEAHTLPDSICLLSIGFPGPYTVEYWPSNAVLAESLLEVDNAPEGVFLEFLKRGRYAWKLQCDGLECLLIFPNRSLSSARTSQGIIQEKLSVRVFIPENFEKAGDHLWTKIIKP